MDQSVFDLFEQTPYTFLEISRGTVTGNLITNTHEAFGVFKLRNEKQTVNNQELRQSSATLHVKPTESFITSIAQGQGVRVDGQDYEIVGQTGGKNYDTGVMEHYTLLLQVSDYSDYRETS